MKQIIITVIALMGLVMPAQAELVSGVTVSDVQLNREESKMNVDMNVDMSALKVSSNRAVLLTPVITNGENSVELNSIGVYGHRRYIYYQRKEQGMLSGSADELTYKASQKPNNLNYHTTVPYESWMNGAEVIMTRKEYACCNQELASETGRIGSYFDRASYMPQMVYVKPQAVEVKTDELEGSANIQFPINQTYIQPSLANNSIELGKIYATIDSVKNDNDITITGIWLKGYASPDGKYENNKVLAAGRTEAIRTYIKNLYNFDNSLLKTSSEPEDWEGVKNYLAASNLSDRDEILDIINKESNPDAREYRIRIHYPESYTELKENCYPALRHTDYRVTYNIRRYSDVNDIKRVFSENPRKLSLNELYLAAQTYEPGSSEFNKIFETAVLLYPNDETANLNAANVAMSRRELERASSYLSKAGDTAESQYARGVLATLQGDYSAAKGYLTTAKNAGIQEAGDVLEVISRF